MKKNLNTNITAIAALTSNHNTAVAVLSFSVGSLDSENNERVQLLPDGEFSATDGRPFDVSGGKWLMDEQAFVSLKANAEKRANDYLFDYEHQTLNSEDNGKEAPAAGWFKDLEYIPGQGVFATKVDWTNKAQAHIDDKEYRYTSAVFSYDTETGRPIGLMHAALTNAPALDGMKAIAALTANHNFITPKTHSSGEEPMKEAMTLLLSLLGEAIDGEDLTNAVALKAAQERATVAITALKAKADKAGTLETDLKTAEASVVALKAKGGAVVDPAKYVPIETYNAIAVQVAALKNGSDENSIEQLLKANAAKIIGQADRDYLESLGKSAGVAALKEALEPRVAIAALTQTQTHNKETPQEKSGALSAEAIAVCKNMGLSQDEYKAELAKDAGEK